MRLSEVFTAKSISTRWTEAASNRTEYLGEGLFPAKKKQGLDLKWIRGHKGLPVSLMPSNFDAKSTLRSREGFKIDETEMAFFRESMLVKEADEQEIMRVQDSNDPYANDVLNRIYDDVNTLLEGAMVVPERMRMQLLCPDVDGSPKILIAADGKQYSYNYDTDGSYAANNYKALTGTSAWSDHAASDPMADLEAGIEAVEALTGARPTVALMNRVTFNHMKANANVRNYVLAQNATANIMMNDARLKELISTELGLTVILYNKQYKDEAGQIHKFYKDGFVTLLPDGDLGSTWYGVTPEERALQGSGEAKLSIVNTGVAVVVKVTEDPVNTKTTVSEIVLPSFERMNETYVLKVLE